MSEIKYVIGDATLPEGEGPRIIAHICNDYGGWGAGFVLALSQRDAAPEMAYRSWFAGDGPTLFVPKAPFSLGKVQIARYDPFQQKNVYVANMIAQKGDKCSMVFLAMCLNKLRVIAENLGASVHMPRIGTGLGGAKWEHVELLVSTLLARHGVPVTVYDLFKKNAE